mmetsp:Transcript_2893/g.7764  ORF Transcript_2893/g.7764 Transcript_2893/m.7764 type:complete len:396 (-) Transcript_2893:368-1555(-)
MAMGLLVLLGSLAGHSAAARLSRSGGAEARAAASELSGEWSACRRAEAEDRSFWGAQWDSQEEELLQVQAAAAAMRRSAADAPPNVSAPRPANASRPPSARKHSPSPLAGLNISLNPKTPADLLPTLAMLKALYAEGKERIAKLNEREKLSKQQFESKEVEHKARLAKIEGKVTDHKLSAAFAANETHDENRLWSYWQRVRERQHRQFHTSLKIQHGTMEREKQMIDMYEKTIAGTADKESVASELSKVAGGSAPEVVFAQGAALLQASSYCAAALAEVRAARRELREGEQSRFVCGQQTSIAVSTSANAAGTAEFSEISTSDGVCKTQNSDKVTAIKFCGPGELTLSRMQCSDHHEYKAMVVKHSSADYTTNCETIATKGTVVEGWLGSFTLSC